MAEGIIKDTEEEVLTAKLPTVGIWEMATMVWEPIRDSPTIASIPEHVHVCRLAASWPVVWLVADAAALRIDDNEVIFTQMFVFAKQFE